MATILIADDRPINRLYLVTLLGYYGHRLLEAADGEQALELARSERPDLVITDLLMPILDGQELTEQMRADPALAKIPVLFYSAAYSLPQARVVAQRVGAFDVLPKPGDAGTIVATVHAALGISSDTPARKSADEKPFGDAAPSHLTQELADLELASQRLAAPIQMSLEFAAERDPSRLLLGLAHMARELLGAKYASIGLVKGDGGTARVILVSGGGRHAAFDNPQVPMVEPAGEAATRDAILNDVLAHARTVRLHGVEAGEFHLRAAGLTRLTNALAVPFIWDGFTRGWLLVADKLGGQDFTDGDAGVVSTLATHGASAYAKVHEQRDREEDLRKSRATFQALFEAAPDAMLSTDASGIIRSANAQAAVIFGYAPNELAGLPIEELMPQRYRSGHRSLRGGYYHEPRLRPMGVDVDLKGRRKNGSEFPVDIMLSPLETPDGKVVLSIVRDITQRRQNEARILELNAELRDRVAELQASNTSLETFSYSVSHDLRSPLRAIDGFAQVLADEYGNALDGEGRRLLNVIADKCHRMGKLIDDLLAFSRLGRYDIVKSEVKMTELARSAVEEIRASEPSRQIEVTVGHLPRALGDCNLIRQVFLNLASNAWKFTRGAQPAQVEIGSYQNGDGWVYFVKDNGIGFDSQYAHKLFEVFERLHTADEFEGTGIGLALVQRIVQRHGGKAWATGKPGAGATFCFTLGPALQEEPTGSRSHSPHGTQNDPAD